MALVLKDRVKETTTTTGTGSISLAGAVSGYQAFSTIGDGNTTYYTIVGGTQWETGVGTYSTSGNTLARTTLLASSTGSAIDFAAGSKDVFCGMPADKVITNDIGTLAVTHGGTGQTSYTDGQLLIGNTTGNTLAKATLTAGTGISVTNGSGSITVANSGVTAYPGSGIAVSTGSAWGTSKTSPSGDIVGTTDTQSLSAKTLTGAKETKTASSGNNFDLSAANYFTHTLSGATTLSVSNTASSGSVSSFVLDLTNGGSATITWWSGMKWAGGTAPTLTSSGRDVLGFFTHDGGTTWNGLVLGKDVK